MKLGNISNCLIKSLCKMSPKAILNSAAYLGQFSYSFYAIFQTIQNGERKIVKVNSFLYISWLLANCCEVPVGGSSMLIKQYTFKTGDEGRTFFCVSL